MFTGRYSYVFRIALSNARIVGLDGEMVAIQYKDCKTGRARNRRLSGEEFIRRFFSPVCSAARLP